MKEKDTKFLNKWRNVRNKGKLLYVLSYSLLVVVAAEVFVNLFIYIITGNDYFNRSDFWVRTGISIIYVSIIAIFGNLNSWKHYEIKYNNLLSK